MVRLDGRCVCGAPLVAKKCDYCGVKSSWAKEQKVKEADNVKGKASDDKEPEPSRDGCSGCLSIGEVLFHIFDIFS